MDKKKTIIFCLPGSSFSNNFLISWTNVILKLSKRYNVLLSQKTGSNIYHLRNACLGGDVLAGENQKPFQGKVEYDFIFWIDSDSVFKVEDVERIINYDKNVVSGLYLMSDGINFATVDKGNWNFEKFKNNGGYFNFLQPKDLLLKDTKLFPVDYTGFGFICFKKGVFEKLKYPWFEPLYFSFTYDNKNIKDFCSEDVALCRKLIDHNIEILCDPLIIIGHEKMYIHHVNIQSNNNNLQNNINNMHSNIHSSKEFKNSSNIINQLNNLANNITFV